MPPFPLTNHNHLYAYIQVNDICARARKAQLEWAKTSFKERRRVLNTMQKYIVAHMEDIARTCARDSGKPSASCVFLALEALVYILFYWGERAVC